MSDASDVRRKDYVREPLIRDYVLEQANLIGSLTVSFAEAAWRNDDTLAGIHLEQIRLVGRELVRAFHKLEISGGCE